MDKKKRQRFSGHPNDKIGTPLGIHDCDMNELHSGDKITWHTSTDGYRRDYTGRILWNSFSESYDLMIDYSMWYGDDEFSEDSYGKSLPLPMDDGARMALELIESVV